MEGDIENIEKIEDIEEKYKEMKYIEEVNEVGMYGENGGGIKESEGIENRIDIIEGKIEKEFGEIGGYIKG